MEFFIILLVAVAVFGFKSFVVIPQQEVHVVERLGRFHRALTAGLNILIPFIDRVAYRHSLKEIPFRRTQPGLHHARQHPADG